MDAAQIEGHHLRREFLGAVDQFSMGRFALPTHVLFQNLLQTVAQQLDAVAKLDNITRLLAALSSAAREFAEQQPQPAKAQS